MPYVQRDEEGKIIAVSVVETTSAREWVEAGMILNADAARKDADPAVVRALSESDRDLIRVVEDVVDLLIDRNLLRFTDLPAAAREKLMQRRALRKALNPLTLLGGVEGDVI